jgi:CRISPR-associated protein Cmr5
MNRTLAQERAGNALAVAKRIKEATENDRAFQQNYRSYVERLGPAILMNGLGQALASERAATDGDKARADAHRALYQAVSDWLCRDGGVYPAGQDVLEAITSNDRDAYLRAQAEALAWLDWHKKFCRAMFPRGGGQD